MNGHMHSLLRDRTINGRCTRRKRGTRKPGESVVSERNSIKVMPSMVGSSQLFVRKVSHNDVVHCCNLMVSKVEKR